MGSSKSYPQDQLHIENCAKFCSEVEVLVATSDKQAEEQERKHGRKRPRTSYMQAVLLVAERQNMEETKAASLLSPDLKEKLRVEAESLNLIPKQAALPF